MRIGTVALALAFILSGIYNIAKPGLSWGKKNGREGEKPPRDVVVKHRVIGVIWLLLGVLLAVYIVLDWMRGA